MMLGVVFAAAVRAARLRGVGGLFAGMVFGLAALVLMTFVTAPGAEALFGGEPFVTEIPDIVGWGTWVVGHLMFGVVLGLWPLLRPGDVAGGAR